MRFRFVRPWIVSFLSWPLAVSGAAGNATVKVESAAVYSRRSASAEVVKSLKKGDTVVVGMALAGEDGEWCSVREPDQKTSLGYMRCEQLEREPRPQPVIIAPEPAAPPATPRQTPPVASPTRPAPRYGPMDGGENYIRPLRTWSGGPRLYPGLTTSSISPRNSRLRWKLWPPGSVWPVAAGKSRRTIATSRAN